MCDQKRDKQPTPRLPSLSGADRRDLPVQVPPSPAASASATFSGGGSRSRSSFTPNLAAAGKRSTASSSTSSDARSGRKEPRQKREKKPNERFKKEKKEIIQTKSIFSEGISAVKAKKDIQSSGSTTSVIGTTNKPGFKSKPSFLDSLAAGSDGRRVRFDDEEKPTMGAVKREVVHGGGALESDEDALKRLMASSFIADVKEPKKKFVDLPLFKIEVSDDIVKMETDHDVKQLISKSEGNISFIQLPSILSELMLSGSKKPEEDNSNEDVKPQIEPSHTLDALPEGRIGVFQILRSGKIRLKIGDLVMNVEPGSDIGCLQELVSMDRTKMCVLGQVKQRLIATPDLTSYS